MADRLDVAGRLAEGLPAVERTQRYVRACQVLGYENPGLTSSPARICDWYHSEEGLDLHTLDRDCAQLRAAGVAVLDALRMEREQLAALAAAWTGPGADSAVGFLQRHCDAASLVANEVRAAAQRCESLRDNLWYLLDAKVAHTVEIDERTAAQRSAWLAAADSVTTGMGDRQMAEAVIRHQVTPYVHNDIGNDWLDVMRSTQAGIATAYDMVTDRAAAAPLVQFEIPAEFVAGRAAFLPAPPDAPAAVAPVAGIPPAVAPAAAIPSPPADAPPADAPPADVPPAAGVAPAAPVGDIGSLPTAGDPGGGGSGLGGLGGLATRIVDALVGLLSPADDQGADDPLDGGALDEDPFQPDAAHDDVDDKPDTEGMKHDGVQAVPAVDAAPPADGPAPAAAQPVAAGPGPGDNPPPAALPPSGGSAPAANPAPADGSTPCEIAADQLPQAGQ